MVAAPESSYRRHARINCKIKAIADHNGKRTPATVLDLSMGGLSLYLRADIEAEIGGVVTVETDEVGSLTGKVQWISAPRIGLAVSPSSNTAAKIDSFLKMHD